MRSDIKNCIVAWVKALQKGGINYDYFLTLHKVLLYGLQQDTKCKHEYKRYLDWIMQVANDEVVNDPLHKDKWRSLYWMVLKSETLEFFESFMLYMEMKRPFEKKFYEPRQKVLKTIVDDLQALEDSGEQKMYGLSLPSRTGKSTLIIFFMVWVILRHPYSHNAIGTHSGVLARHFYKEVMELLTSNEYTYQELYQYIYPGQDFIADKSAEELTISVATKGDFPTITCRGIDGTWTGAVDISSDGYLAVDDLVRDRTHSLSPKRMNDTFNEYLNKMEDRRNDGSKILMIGTLWNVLDPLCRLEDMYKDDNRYVFRKIPALDENDESNFQYEVKGFSTQYYREMRDKLVMAGGEADWMAKFQQAPYRREGILFPLDELRWFNGILPEGHRFKFVSVCDVAFGGGDSVSMPVALQDLETDWLYIVDWYFSSSGVKVTVPGVCDKIIKYGIKDITFERNSGGLMYAQRVQEELNKRGYVCSCDTKPAPNDIDKQSKIKAYEGIIKAKVLFLDDSKTKIEGADEETVVYKSTSQYKRALEEMSMFASIGKNQHDDAPDSISQLCIKAYGDINSSSEVELIDRTFIGF